MRRVLLGLVVALMGTVVGTPGLDVPPVRAAGSMVVESTDSGGSAAECPGENCTLRGAIETANADDSGGAYSIAFAPETFDPESPATITVGLTPLPEITRDGVVIDASGSGVRLRHDDPSLSNASNGLVISANDVTIMGLDIAGFPAACILVEGNRATVGGDRSLGRGNRLGACPTGIAVHGIDATIVGNTLLKPAPDQPGFTTAIYVAASGANIGPDAPGIFLGNFIGDAETAIAVQGTAEAPTGEVRIRHNSLGRTAAGSPAPNGTGVTLGAFTSGTLVLANIIANSATGISVADPDGGPPVDRNIFSGNTFASITTLAIDLGGDGIANPNDDGDGDIGPNAWLNHPLITRATQSRIEGTACPGCEVQVYAAVHLPGGIGDFGSLPLPVGNINANAGGTFAVDSPPVSPGEWVIALAIDADGNTSEFGPANRVGAGAVQCGNLDLRAGWNHVGFFGPQTVILGDTFPADPTGAVTAIYRAVDGGSDYERWFKETPIGRTLTLVEPGESYWMFAEAPVTLAGGFSVSFPLPVELEAGWNDFVYVGATADVSDALLSISGKYRDLYEFDRTAGRFLRYGSPSVPAWAREFAVLTACATYQVFMEEPGTLIPLQP